MSKGVHCMFVPPPQKKTALRNTPRNIPGPYPKTLLSGIHLKLHRGSLVWLEVYSLIKEVLGSLWLFGFEWRGFDFSHCNQGKCLVV